MNGVEIPHGRSITPTTARGRSPGLPGDDRSSTIRTFTVTHAGPLLPALLEAWPEAKRKQVLIWLKHRTVLVNGAADTRFDRPLIIGDVVRHSARGHAPAGTRVGSHMKIRHEDDAVIVIEKPSGLLSIASEGERERSAYFQLTEHVRGGNPRSRAHIWIVHRLDRDTSGLMVFARTAEAQDTLQPAGRASRRSTTRSWRGVRRRREGPSSLISTSATRCASGAHPVGHTPVRRSRTIA